MKSTDYLELMKKVLLDLHRVDLVEFTPAKYFRNSLKSRILRQLNYFLQKKGYYICTKVKSDLNTRIEGRDWPIYADTMIGLKRLDNIEFCINQILKENIKGDFIETGVWRGGATIFMNAVLQFHNIPDRIIWVADSFEGLPKPNESKYAFDKNDQHHMFDTLAVSMETVKSNFAKYGLLTANVNFLKGWFKDTLPTAPIEKLSLLRLDGDMYESTMDALINLYPKVSAGGFIIIDDWGSVSSCKQAVLDFRNANSIDDKMEQIDYAAIYWRKS